MKIRNFPRATLFNIRRSMKGETPVLPPRPPPKPYNHLRGKIVNVVGEEKRRGPFIDIGGMMVFVNSENIESIDPPSEGVTCVGCGKVAKVTRQQELLNTHARNETSRPEVEQEKYWIGSAYPGAYTSGLATCAALQVEVGGFQFLAHISAETDMTEMEKKLREMFKEKKDKKPSITIWSGTGGSANDPVHIEEPSAVSVGKIKALLTKLGIKLEDVTEYPVCYAATVPL